MKPFFDLINNFLDIYDPLIAIFGIAVSAFGLHYAIKAWKNAKKAKDAADAAKDASLNTIEKIKNKSAIFRLNATSYKAKTLKEKFRAENLEIEITEFIFEDLKYELRSLRFLITDIQDEIAETLQNIAGLPSDALAIAATSEEEEENRNIISILDSLIEILDTKAIAFQYDYEEE